MVETLQYKFAGTDGLVDLSGCDVVADFLPSVFQNWPYERVQTQSNASETLFKIEKSPSHFTLSSPIFDTKQHLEDPLNITCSLVAQLAWARLRHDPEMLCFHGAAIEVNGALVLLPNKRRAGKSTLTACLADLGYKVFTDDYLPIEIDENGVIYGHANGAAPRLRLPLPEEFSPELTGRLNAVSGLSNRQYLYLNPPGSLLADHGERLPVSTIVMLEREPGGGMALTQAKPAEVLRRVILQNFSRHMNPARILGIIDHLVQSTRGLDLRYESAEAAAAFLSKELNEAHCFDASSAYGTKPDLAQQELCEEEHALAFNPDQKYVQLKDVVEKDYQTDCFVASKRGARIHHMDQMARAIWNLLREPAKLDDIVEVFQSAFPEMSEDDLHRDISQTLEMFAKEGLLDHAN
ncbi:PqqD family protein [uncultured Shimia sp.]|uniref:PqqD family protein n=1 Tax=uncultured Shimia sp. TaxID=573152 RepID=UPI00260CA1B5|nr:PqqD family protein [uncultured Shimia sp.]